MKKNIIKTLTFLFLVMATVGCSKPIQENCGCLPETTQNDVKYQLTVDSGSKDICPDAPKSGMYAEGTKFSFKILTVTDVTFHPYLDDLRIKPTKESVILGQYSFYEFEMPNRDATLTITGDEFFYDKEYSISQISGSFISPEHVNKVSIEQGGIGVDPATANPTVTYSEDREDIEHNVSVVMLPFMIKTDAQMRDGGRYVAATFYLDDGTETSITIENDLYIYRSFSNYQTFTFKEGAPRFEIKHPITGDNR